MTTKFIEHTVLQSIQCKIYTFDASFNLSNNIKEFSVFDENMVKQKQYSGGKKDSGKILN